MTIPPTKSLRPLIFAALIVVGVLALLAAMPLAGLPSVASLWKGRSSGTTVRVESPASAALVPGRPDTVALPPDVVRSLHVVTVAADPAAPGRALEMSGKLALDVNHLARVHSRFAGEVVEIASAQDPNRPGGATAYRPLRVGDKVEANQLLAVVWSKDLGEKKSELVDALSRLRLSRGRLARLQVVYREGAVPERTLREAEQTVEADRIAVAKAEQTLRTWRLTDKEIAAVKAEGERPLEAEKTNGAKDKGWAKVEVRAPFFGTVVERNVTVGDIVDTAADLFKIADTRTLAVWADAYEEELPDLIGLKPEQRAWTVRLKAQPSVEFKGVFDFIGEIIDPGQHTALVTGRVDNPGDRLRANQFINATVELPPSPGEVVIPATALIDDGLASVVFVQPDPSKPEFTRRRVAVGRRFPDTVTVLSQLSDRQKAKGLQPVRAGERVVRSSAVELKKALDELQAGGDNGD